MKGKFAIVAVLALALMVGCGGTKAPSSPGDTSTPAGQQGAQPGQGQTQTTDSGKYIIAGAESETSYTAHEKFAGQELESAAVGKTSAIVGDLVIEKGAFKPSTITIDLRTLTSDRKQRDTALKNRGLESDKYPQAVFTLSGSEGGALVAGKSVTLKLKGKLNVHGVEKEVVWDAKATLQGGSINLTATTNFVMADFNIEPPSVLGVLTVDGKVQLDVRLVAKKG